MQTPRGPALDVRATAVMCVLFVWRVQNTAEVPADCSASCSKVRNAVSEKRVTAAPTPTLVAGPSNIHGVDYFCWALLTRRHRDRAAGPHANFPQQFLQLDSSRRDTAECEAVRCHVRSGMRPHSPIRRRLQHLIKAFFMLHDAPRNARVDRQ